MCCAVPFKFTLTLSCPLCLPFIFFFCPMSPSLSLASHYAPFLCYSSSALLFLSLFLMLTPGFPLSLTLSHSLLLLLFPFYTDFLSRSSFSATFSTSYPFTNPYDPSLFICYQTHLILSSFLSITFRVVVKTVIVRVQDKSRTRTCRD